MDRFGRFLPPRKALLLALLLGLGLRAGWSFVSPYRNAEVWSEVRNETDLINVHAIDVSHGLGIVNEDGMPSGRRPPGAIFFLAFFYKIFGVHPWVPFVLNQILTVLTLYLLYRITQHLNSPGVTSLSLLLFALNPPGVICSNIVMDEHWAMPLWFWGIDLFLRTWKDFTWRKTFFLGIVFGLASFVRPESSVMPYVAGAAGIFHNKKKLPWLAKTAFLTFIVLAVNFPWAVRNYLAWRKPIYYSATGGFLYATLNPLARGNWSGIPGKETPFYSEELARAKDEGEVHAIGVKLAAQWVKKNPSDFVLLSLQKALFFFSPDSFEWALTIAFEKGEDPRKPPFPAPLLRFLTFTERLFHTVLVYSFFPLTGLFLSLVYRKIDPDRRAAVTFILFAIASRIVMNSVFSPNSRYRFQFEPLMMLLAVYFFYELAGFFSGKRTAYLPKKTGLESAAGVGSVEASIR